MANICEVSKKRYPKKPAQGKRPEVLSRKIEIAGSKEAVRLNVSSNGLKLLNEAGGLVNFLKERETKSLLPRLARLKKRLCPDEPKKAASEEAPAEKAEPAAEEAKEEPKAEETKEEPKAEKAES